MNRLLDAAVQDTVLDRWYPYLQTACTIDAAGVERLKESLRLDRAPAAMYRHLSAGRTTNPIPAADLREILLAILAKPSGFEVATDILWMRIHGNTQPEPPPELVEAGRELLRMFTFDKRNDHEDFNLGQIARSCLNGKGGEQVTEEICCKFKLALLNGETHAFYHNDLLEAIFQAQPIAALEALYPGDSTESRRVTSALESLRDRKSLLKAAPLNDLLDWCDKDGDKRYPALARIAEIFTRSSNSASLQWTEMARALLSRAPDPGIILRQFLSRLANGAGFGLLASGVAEAHLPLLDKLSNEPRLSAILDAERKLFLEAIKQQREIEHSFSRQMNERFE